MKYAVVIYYSFDNPSVYEFDDYDEAEDYIKDLWEQDYKQELEEGVIGLDESGTFYDNEQCWGKIQFDDGEFMEYSLINIIKPMDLKGIRG